jgi:hypothetical protein
MLQQKMTTPFLSIIFFCLLVAFRLFVEAVCLLHKPTLLMGWVFCFSFQFGFCLVAEKNPARRSRSDFFRPFFVVDTRDARLWCTAVVNPTA